MAKAMTKSQLVRQLSEKAGVARKAAAAMLEELLETAVRETKNKGTFVVPGIGKLRKAHRKARMGRNPQTGDDIEITARRVLTFRPSQILKSHINEPVQP